MNLSKKIASNTIIQVGGRIISLFLGLIAVAIITRYLGSAGFGQYTTIFTFVFLFSVLADLGLTLVTTQMISKEGADEKKLLANLFLFRIISAVFIIGLAPIIVYFFPYNTAIQSGVLIAGLAFFFLSLNQVLVSLFQKKLKTERMAIAEIISRLVFLIAVVYVQKNNLGLNGVLWSLVISSFVSFFFHYILAQKLVVIKLKFNYLIWREIISRSWPLLLTVVFNLIYLKADILILSVLKNDQAVGVYGAAYKIIDACTAFPFLFSGIMLPILVNRWSNNLRQEFFKILQRMFDLSLIIVLPLIIGGYVLAQPIMFLITGSDPGFANAASILQILLLAVGAIFLSSLFTYVMISFDQQRKMIKYYLFTALTSIPIYFILIQRWSYYGAAWGTVYSEGLIFLFSFFAVWKESKFLPQIAIARKSFFAAIMMAAVLVLGKSWIGISASKLSLALLLAILFYFLILYMIKGINKADILALIKEERIKK